MSVAPLFKQILTERLLKTVIRFPSQLNLSPNVMRFSTEQLSRIFPQNTKVNIRPLQIAGLKLEELKTREDATQLILYFHGGAFFLGSLNTHRPFLTQLTATTKMQVLHVEYPLAPESPFPYALEYLFELYKELLEQGVLAKDIVLAGDSCGANLALALALKIRDAKLPQVNSLVLISPLLDLSLSSPSLRFNQKHDAILSLEFVKTGIAHYVPTRIDRANPQVSPLFADLRNLPPVLIQVGSKEILLDDAKRLHTRLNRINIDVTLKIYTGMSHGFHLFHAWFEEGAYALKDFADFVQQHDRT